MLFAARGANGVVASAIAADLLDANAGKRGLPPLSTVNYLAGTLGFATAGFLIESAGLFIIYAVAAALAIASAASLIVGLPSQGKLATHRHL